jgi:hypothetical protein
VEDADLRFYDGDGNEVAIQRHWHKEKELINLIKSLYSDGYLHGMLDVNPREGFEAWIMETAKADKGSKYSDDLILKCFKHTTED